jgi:outer membrane lipoprotein-sorting protein
MPLRRAIVVLCLTAAAAVCQPAASVLTLLDRFSKTFTGAKADLRSTNHLQGVPEDDVQTGTFLVRKSGSKTEFRVDFKQPNAQSVVVNDRTLEIYRPKLNETQVYDVATYHDIVQKLFLLGFGMPGRELGANYDIRNSRHETVDGQAATYLELIPKSPDVRKQLTRVEIWISDKTVCPVRQTFHSPDGGFRTAQFSNLEVNPKFPANAFELPKSAKRVKAN